MTPGENQTTADPRAGIEILSMPAELDVTTSDGVVEQGYAAIARSGLLLLLDLTGMLLRRPRAQRLRPDRQPRRRGRMRFALIAPQPPVTKVLRITGLDCRMPVFATIEDALALRTASASV